MGSHGLACKRRIFRVLALAAVVVGVLVTLAAATGPGGWDDLGDGGTPGRSLNRSVSALRSRRAGLRRWEVHRRRWERGRRTDRDLGRDQLERGQLGAGADR